MQDVIGAAEARAMLDSLSECSEGDLTRLSFLLRMVFRCYTKDSKAKGVFVYEDAQTVRLLSVNCNEMGAIEMVEQCREIMNAHLMEGAPKKEMFN